MMTKEGSTKTVNFMTPRGRGSCAGAWQYKLYGEKTSLLPGYRTDKLFQPNLTQSILGWGGLKFVQMKDHIIFQRGKIWLTLLIVKITRLLIISISSWGESGLSQVLSIHLFPRPLWLHQSLSGTRGPVFSFRWFCSRFLLDGLSFFYHQVSEMAIFVCLVLSILNACPNHFHHLHLMTMLIFSISVLCLTSSFVTLCGQYIFNILLRPFCINVSIMLWDWLRLKR